MKNMRKRSLTVREYTEDFYKVNIRASYTEDSYEKVARYMNGIKLEIQDELSVLSQNTVEEAYQCALKLEEKLSRGDNSGKGKGQAYRGKGQQDGKNKFSTQKEEVDTSNQQEQSSRGRGRDFRGRISF